MKIDHLMCFFLLMLVCVMDALSAREIDKKSVSVKKTQGFGVQLQAVKAPLSSVLDELGRVSGARMHYSILSDELVTATCVADSLKQILKCLLGDMHNVAIQYSQDVADSDQAGNPIDVWILGSSLAKHGNMAGCEGESRLSVTVIKKKSVRQADEKLIAQLMLRLDIGDSKQRADAISGLATKTAIDNADVDDAILTAMNDKSVLVREQALSGWVYRKGEGATAELQLALQDANMSVRMTVVDLTQDKGLLAQATADANRQVQEYAQMKLQAMEQSQPNE